MSFFLNSLGGSGSLPDFSEYGDLGLWVEPGDVSTLWKNTAGDDPVTVSSDIVKAIDDKSVNGFRFANASSGHTYQTDQINGESVLRFDGGGSALVATGVDMTDIMGSNETFTWFYVWKQVGTRSRHVILSMGPGLNGMVNLFPTYDNVLYFDAPYSPGRSYKLQPANWDNVFHSVMMRRNGIINNIIRVDGTNIETDVSVSGSISTAPVNVSLGDYNFGGGIPAEGDLALLLCYKSATDTLRDDVEAKINEKFFQ